MACRNRRNRDVRGLLLVQVLRERVVFSLWFGGGTAALAELMRILGRGTAVQAVSIRRSGRGRGMTVYYNLYTKDADGKNRDVKAKAAE